MRFLTSISGVAAWGLFAGVGAAQNPKPRAPKDTSLAAQAKRDTVKRAKLAKMPHDSLAVARFFERSEPLPVTLVIDVKRIRSDRDANAPYRQAVFRYKNDSGGMISVPARVRTRGIWRLKTCEFPPLRINFTSEATKHTVFKGLDKPKLVNYCRDDDAYEQYLLQEYQLYRVYRLLTPASHAVRLMRITYEDSASGKVQATRYGFMEEDPDAVAARMNGKMLKITGAGPGDLEPYQDALVGVFQYFIGNTDFALSALHNAELLGRNNGDYLPIVYDFDFAGAVNARYATPDPRLHINSVRDRLYRGYCVPDEEYPKVFALFNAKKDSIYALYRDTVGKLIRPSVVDETLGYFDQFYKTINDPRAAKASIVEACLGKKK
ncbi:MAG TPA: hypothetical protein VN706_10375 [Gemmatimonadaceae bacterium]|nr:hypothetical protein [Gemmatimonadaceae bacterium]